jgi:hypothetical protein
MPTPITKTRFTALFIFADKSTDTISQNTFSFSFIYFLEYQINDDSSLISDWLKMFVNSAQTF